MNMQEAMAKSSGELLSRLQEARTTITNTPQDRTEHEHTASVCKQVLIRRHGWDWFRKNAGGYYAAGK